MQLAPRRVLPRLTGMPRRVIPRPRLSAMPRRVLPRPREALARATHKAWEQAVLSWQRCDVARLSCEATCFEVASMEDALEAALRAAVGGCLRVEPHAALEAHAETVRPFLGEWVVPGDGNCLFRSVVSLLGLGDGREERKSGEALLQTTHWKLRRWVVDCVLDRPDRFACMFADMDAMKEWALEMGDELRPEGPAYGDAVALRCLVDIFEMPCVVWCVGREGHPLCFVPRGAQQVHERQPWYLRYDGRKRLEEHWSPLLHKPSRVHGSGGCCCDSAVGLRHGSSAWRAAGFDHVVAPSVPPGSTAVALRAATAGGRVVASAAAGRQQSCF